MTMMDSYKRGQLGTLYDVESVRMAGSGMDPGETHSKCTMFFSDSLISSQCRSVCWIRVRVPTAVVVYTRNMETILLYSCNN